LKVLMVSTSFPENARDWQGRFIANLVAALGNRKDTSMALWSPPGELPESVAAATTIEEAAWLHGLAQRGGIAHLLRNARLSAPFAAVGLLRRLRSAYKRSSADIVHVNWLQNALPLWGTTTPMVASVLGTDFALLRLPGMKASLRAILRQRRAVLAPNADWMTAELEHAFGDIAEICHVPFGVDETWFDSLRIPFTDTHREWLAITRLTKNKLGDLFNWGDGFFGTERLLHLFGPMQEEIAVPAWVRYHGPTNPHELRTSWFPRAAGLITLSRHDEGRPQVMLEAMAAGLPVIASDLPAHRDTVIHRQTGWIATSREDLGTALAHLDDPGHNRAAGEAGRSWVKENIGTWDDCADRYAALYRKLLRQGS
jgi:glycosyltransferase involved in cell wall biosynthesis